MTEQTLLIIGSVWPEPSSSAAGRRMMQLISLFDRPPWTVTVASTTDDSPYCADLDSGGIRKKKISVNDSGFDQFVEQLQSDVVIFDRFIMEEQFGWRVAEACPDAVRILDTEDLHCLRRRRKRAVKEGLDFSKDMLLEDDTARREVASIYRSDLALIISEYEMNLLRQLFGVDDSLLHYLPFLLPSITEKEIEGRLSFEERQDFVTIGNFRHPPNWDAVQYLKSTIWPLVRRELPEARLRIYGAYPSQKVWDLHRPAEGFHIEGRAEKASEVVEKGRVLLAPIRFGAGLKGKLVEAMQCGTPSVTTKVGAEGIAGDLPWSGAIAEDPWEIATRAAALYTDQSRWEEAQKQGQSIINKRFDKNKFSNIFKDRLQAIKRQWPEHRRNNFVGSMLRHHSNNSTKYMSKWIEEKNRP